MKTEDSRQLVSPTEGNLKMSIFLSFPMRKFLILKKEEIWQAKK